MKLTQLFVLSFILVSAFSVAFADGFSRCPYGQSGIHNGVNIVNTRLNLSIGNGSPPDFTAVSSVVHVPDYGYFASFYDYRPTKETLAAVYNSIDGCEWKPFAQGNFQSLKVHPGTKEVYGLDFLGAFVKLNVDENKIETLPLPNGSSYARYIEPAPAGKVYVGIDSFYDRVYKYENKTYTDITPEYILNLPETLPAVLIMIRPHPSDPQTIYAAYVMHGLFRTRDGGESWEQVNNGFLRSKTDYIQNVWVVDFDSNPDTMYAKVTTHDGGILWTYISNNGGDGWNDWIGPGLERNVIEYPFIKQVYRNPVTGHIFLNSAIPRTGGADSFLYRSTNDGKTFEKLDFVNGNGGFWIYPDYDSDFLFLARFGAFPIDWMSASRK